MLKIWTVELTNGKSEVFTNAVDAMEAGRVERDSVITELTIDIKSKAIVSSETF